MKPSTACPSRPCSAWPRKNRHATGVTAMLTKYEAIIATADGDRQGREELAGEAGEQDDRQEHRHRRQRRSEDRQRDGVGALQRRLGGAHAHPLVPMDRLEHDHGVVDEAPHGQREAAERERVERLARRVEDDERDRERERDGDRDDERPADALEKEEDDQRDEDERLERSPS